DVVAKKQFSRDLTSDEWASSDLSYTPDDTVPTVRKPTGSLTGLTGRFSKPPTGSLPSEPAVNTTIPGPKRGLTGSLTPIPEPTPQPEPISADELPDFMQEMNAPAPEAEAAPETASPVYTGDLPDLADLVPDSAAPAEDLPFRRERTIEPEDNDPLA